MEPRFSGVGVTHWPANGTDPRVSMGVENMGYGEWDNTHWLVRSTSILAPGTSDGFEVIFQFPTYADVMGVGPIACIVKRWTCTSILLNMGTPFHFIALTHTGYLVDFVITWDGNPTHEPYVTGEQIDPLAYVDMVSVVEIEFTQPYVLRPQVFHWHFQHTNPNIERDPHHETWFTTASDNAVSIIEFAFNTDCTPPNPDPLLRTTVSSATNVSASHVSYHATQARGIVGCSTGWYISEFETTLGIHVWYEPPFPPPPHTPTVVGLASNHNLAQSHEAAPVARSELRWAGGGGVWGLIWGYGGTTEVNYLEWEFNADYSGFAITHWLRGGVGSDFPMVAYAQWEQGGWTTDMSISWPGGAAAPSVKMERTKYMEIGRNGFLKRFDCDWSTSIALSARHIITHMGVKVPDREVATGYYGLNDVGLNKVQWEHRNATELIPKLIGFTPQNDISLLMDSNGGRMDWYFHDAVTDMVIDQVMQWDGEFIHAPFFQSWGQELVDMTEDFVTGALAYPRTFTGWTRQYGLTVNHHTDLENVILNGGSVLYHGQIILSVDQLPGIDELAELAGESVVS